MRKLFLLPLKFLVFFIISAIIMSFFVLIFSWGQNFSRASGGENSLLLFFTVAAGNIIFPSVSAALLFTVFDSRKKSLGIIAPLLLAVSVFAVLFFGLRFSATLEIPEESLNFQPFQDGYIHVVEDGLIYTGTIGSDDSGEIIDLITRKHDNSLPGFEYYSRGDYLQHPESRLSAEGSEKIKIVPANPVYDHIFKAEGLFAGYLRDISFCNSIIFSAADEGGIDFLFLCGAFTAFLVICVLFKGLTSWPLFEMILILFFHRLGFYLVALFSSEANFISETFFGGKPVPDIPLYTILALSILLLLCSLLLKTSNRLRKK